MYVCLLYFGAVVAVHALVLRCDPMHCPLSPFVPQKSHACPPLVLKKATLVRPSAGTKSALIPHTKDMMLDAGGAAESHRSGLGQQQKVLS